MESEPKVFDMTYLDPEDVDPRQRAEAWERSRELCRTMNERAAEQRRLYGRGAISYHRAPSRRGRGPSGRPAGRRRTAASSRTASADPGDPEPERPLRACKPPGGVYTFGGLTAAERGAEVVS